MPKKKMSSSSKPAQEPRGDEYTPLLEAVRSLFAAKAGNGPLFTTDAEDLWHTFLAALPPRERQHHNCQACRHFVQRFGGLVSIDARGRTTPVMWGSAPGFYAAAFAALDRKVGRAKVTGVFLSSEKTWGQPVTGIWRHMAVTPPASLVFKASVLKTAGQARAEKREEYGMLCRGLAEFPRDLVAQAARIIESDGALYRSEKVLGPVTFLSDLHDARAGLSGPARDNVTWLAVAKAAPGFCHVRTTMVGSLLEDLAARLPFEDVKRKFNAKMSPLQYQRPQALPSAGNIAQAEKVVAALNAEGSLDRRYARLEDVQVKLWEPRPNRAADRGGIFGNVPTRDERAARTRKLGAVEIPSSPITWEKFARTVMPDAEKIEVLVSERENYIALCTAVNPDAPPILQWDREDRRNPVNWYVYAGGGTTPAWNLMSHTYVSVTAVTTLPPMWNGGHEHQGMGAILILEGCRDKHPLGGSALFPEVLRSELHGVRKTIEAYSRDKPLAGKLEASACGIDLRKGGEWNVTVRVTSHSGNVVACYRLDRWD